MTYKTPGVYVEEIAKFPPSVAEVETAIPAFIGYTQNIEYNGQPLLDKPTRISSLADFEEIFGRAYNETFTITVTATDVDTLPVAPTFVYKMHYCMRLYFANGGGPCYIVSIGQYAGSPAVSDVDLARGLAVLQKEDEPTIILFPDATAMTDADLYYGLYKSALIQCATLGDRVTICDVFQGDQYYRAVGTDVINRPSAPGPTGFRTGIGNNNLKYGAAYYPWLETIYNFAYDATTLSITGGGLPPATTLRKEIEIGVNDADEATSLFHINTDLYYKVVKEIEKLKVILPAGPA
ncbi:MAG: phage tail sheath family protein, partial [Bacteroidota bacterium]